MERIDELKAWLRFNNSATDDYFGNSWTVSGNPTVASTNAEHDNALQLDGSSAISNSTILSVGESYTIDFWLKCPSNLSANATGYILNIYNPTTSKSVTGLYYSNAKLQWFFCGYDGSLLTNQSVTIPEGLFHVAIVIKQSSITTANLFINGVQIGGVSAANYSLTQCDVHIGVRYDNTRFANAGTTIDEFRIYCGCALWTKAFTPPSASEYDGLFFLFDTQRKLKNFPLAQIYYKNPGRADLLTTVNGTTVTGLTAEQSATGVGFYQPDKTACFGISATTEIWIRCDVYTTANYANNDRLRIYSVDSNGANGWATNPTISAVGAIWHNNTGQNTVNIGELPKNTRRSILLHMRSGSSAGLIEVTLKNVASGNEYKDTYTGNVNAGNDFSNVYIQMDGVNIYASNLIISDEPITLEDSFIFPVFDAQREIVKSVSLSLDTERQIVAATIQQDFYVDAQRQLNKTALLAVDVERNISAPISLSCDIERILANLIDVSITVDVQRNLTDEEIWRYENVGLLDELSNPSTLKRQYYDLPTSKSKTGVAFTQFRSNEGIFPIPSTNDVWIKFDVYRESGDALWFVGDRYSGSYSTSVNSDSGDNDDIDIWNTVGSGTVNIATLEDAAKTTGLQTIIVHMEADNSDGIIEVYTDGDGLIYSFNGLVHVGMPFRALTLYSISGDTDEALFSNIVISNGRLDFSDDAHWPDIPITLDLDAQREVGITQNFSADTQIIFGNNFIIADFQADAERYLDAFNKNISETFSTERILNNVVEISIDAQRNIIRNIVVPVYVPPEYNPPSHDAPVFPRPVDNSVIQSCTISMQEQQLTDNISFVYAGNIGIMAAVNLTYMDYVINGRVEETVTKGVLESCQLASDVDELLYQQLAYEIPSGDYEWSDEYNAMVMEYNNANPDKQAEKVPSASASTHIQTIASKLGKNVSLHFADFISTMSTKVESGTTYASLISELFGWTSRIPQMMINVYMRGNTIYVVQRGYEPNTVTLDNANIANVTIKRKIMRTTWGSSPWSKEEVKPIYGSERSVDYVPYPPKDDEEESDSGTTYNDEGLVEETVVEHGDEKVTTKYEYITLGSGQKFLYKEIQETSVRGEGIVDKVVTTHEPVSMGQTQVYSTDDDGVIGSVVTPSRFDDRITPWQQQSGGFGGGSGEYTPGISGIGVYDSDGNFHEFAYDSGGNRYIRKVSYSRTQTGNSSKTIFGIPLVDTSFPVDGNSKLEELTNAIAWLNRKTEESISFELYNYPHVIDFSDKIIVGGNTYFLRSNTATRTETIVNKQTLEIVRWY